MKHLLKFIKDGSEIVVEDLSGERFGVIICFESWKTFVFRSFADSYLDVDCLGQIQRKLEELNKE